MTETGLWRYAASGLAETDETVEHASSVIGCVHLEPYRVWERNETEVEEVAAGLLAPGEVDCGEQRGAVVVEPEPGGPGSPFDLGHARIEEPAPLFYSVAGFVGGERAGDGDSWHPARLPATRRSLREATSLRSRPPGGSLGPGRLGDPESGTVTAFVVVFMLALVVMAGLVLDGGLALSAKVQAIDDAQAAARAGAQAIDVPLYRSTGEITLDPAQATSDAEGFLARAGRTGTASVTGDQVTVTVTIRQPTQILSVVGVDSFTETGSGSATAEQGTP